MIRNFSKLALQANGNIFPLTLNSTESGNTGLTNPSVLWNGKNLYYNIRNVQYALYHSEFGQKFQNHWGCLAYLNPEDDVTLRTQNFLSINDSDYKWIDTSKLDKKPLWEFIGLEDGRLVYWDDKLYLIGVRRDTTTNGVGRMELSEIENGREIKRYRIEPPNGYTYCEKNWMPILDMPFHFVKWTNPTEVVKVNLETLSSETIVLKEQSIDVMRDLRGGSQVIKYKDYYIAITHEVDLWYNYLNNKDAHYYHRFIVWDKDWNIVKHTDAFKFLDANIEFCCGLTQFKDKFLITFGFQDSTAFMLEITEEFLQNFIDGNIEDKKAIVPNNPLNKFVSNPLDSKFNYDLALVYFKEGHFASAMSFFLRSAELDEVSDVHDRKLVYASLIYVAECLSKMGRRNTSLKTALLNAVAYEPNRCEAYFMLSQLSEVSKEFHTCLAMAKLSLEMHAIQKQNGIEELLNIKDYKIKYQIAFSLWWVGRFNESRNAFFALSNDYGTTMEDGYIEMVQGNITRLGSGDKFIPYTKDKKESLKFKFDGYEQIERNYSQTLQDMFIMYMTQGKRNGTYLEIGSADPSYGNNTKILEETFNWVGTGIEILANEVEKHKQERKNPVICADATTINYDELLSKMSKEYGNDGVFDYLQVDCEPPSVSFDILKMIPFEKYKFAVVTFEHDYYADISKSIRKESREYMESKGYVLAIGNISMNDDCPYEDWWVHPELINNEVLKKIQNKDNEVVNIHKFML
jgi:hypothetical protein